MVTTTIERETQKLEKRLCRQVGEAIVQFNMIEEGDKVKVTLRFRGREMSHMDFAMQTFDRLIADLAEHGKIEQEPKQEGRTVVMIVAPASEREKRPAKAREESPSADAVE